MKKIWMFFLALLSLLPEGYAQVQTIGLSLNDVVALKGTLVDVPILADSNFTDKGVYAYSLQLEYNPGAMELDSVITAGTISDVFGSATYKVGLPGYNQGIVTIVGSGSQALEGDGVFIKLRFRALETGWHNLRLTGAGKNYFNEGTPVLTNPVARCYLKIETPPTLHLNPGSATLAKGETVQLEAWDGTPPYVWTVSDSLVARIDASGLLTATGIGSVRVEAVDTLGVSGVSGMFQVLPYRLSIPRDITQQTGKVVDVPVLVSDLTGMDVSSGQFRMQYDVNMLHFEGVDVAGTMLETCSPTVNASTDGRLLVAFANPAALNGSGVLLKARFRLLNPYYGTQVRIDESLFNETLKGAYTDGLVSPVQTSSLSVYPTSGELIVGQSENFTLYGGVQPCQWSVSDTTVASMDASGRLKALKRGTVRVTAVDSTGASVSTDLFNVYDTRVAITDTALCDFTQVVYFPVYMDRIPSGEDLLSFEGSLRFDTTQMEFLGLSQEGTATQDWSGQYRLSSDDQQNATLDLAFSSAHALTSSGVLFYVKLKPRPGFNAYTRTSVRLNRFVFNEGTPTSYLHDYAVLAGQERYSGSATIYDTKGWNQQYCLGDTISVRADVYNVRQATFQWIVNGVDVPGAVLSEWKTTMLSPTDTIRCLVTALDPCVIDPVIWSNELVFPINLPPFKPDSIRGDSVLLVGSSYNYFSVPAQDNVYQYVWSFPRGFDKSTGNYQSVYVNVTDSAQAGWVSVVAINDCGVSDTTYKYIVPVYRPSRPDTLYAPIDVCLGDSVQFRVLPVSNATGYVWTLPYGMYGRSDSTRIWVSVSDSAQAGWVSVRAMNGAVEGEEYTCWLGTKTVPTYAWVQGPSTVSSGEQNVLFEAGSEDGLFYNWLLPEGMTGMSSTNRIYVNVEQSFSGGILAVVPMNACGVGDTAWMSVSPMVVKTDTIYGPGLLCGGTDSVKYQVPEMVGMSGYRWTLSDNLTGYSTTNEIWVSVADTATRAILSVVGYNTLDTSTVVVRYIEVVPKPKPVVIDGPATVTIGDSLVVYSVVPQPGIFHYFWEFPEGFTSVGWSDSIQVTVTDSAKSGWIKVLSYGFCNQGVPDSLYVTVNAVVGLDVVKTALSTYPNPFRETLSLRSPLLTDVQAVVTVFDVFGHALPVEAVGAGEDRTLNFAQQPAGIYLVVVRTPTRMERVKVLKQ